MFFRDLYSNVISYFLYEEGDALARNVNMRIAVCEIIQMLTASTKTKRYGYVLFIILSSIGLLSSFDVQLILLVGNDTTLMTTTLHNAIEISACGLSVSVPKCFTQKILKRIQIGMCSVYQHPKLGLEVGSSEENTGKERNTIVSPTSIVFFLNLS